MKSAVTKFDAPFALLQRLYARPVRLVCLVVAVPMVAAAFAPVLILASRM